MDSWSPIRSGASARVFKDFFSRIKALFASISLIFSGQICQRLLSLITITLRSGMLTAKHVSPISLSLTDLGIAKCNKQGEEPPLPKKKGKELETEPVFAKRSNEVGTDFFASNRLWLVVDYNGASVNATI